MLKNAITLTLALLINSLLFGQQKTSDDYKIYSALISTEIISKTQSVAIVERLKNDTASIPWVTEAIKSKDPQQVEQLRFLTRDRTGNSISSIDTATLNLILAFYQAPLNNIALQDLFDLSNVKVYLIDKFPIKTGSEKEWKRFYKKYPGSGGLFEVSNICYSQNGKEAVFYHSLFRRGLNAHGALTVMKNVNGQWEVKYHINFWQA